MLLGLVGVCGSCFPAHTQYQLFLYELYAGRAAYHTAFYMKILPYALEVFSVYMKICA